MKQFLRIMKVATEKQSNFYLLFDELQPYYDFLNCELIEAIVECFLKGHQVHDKVAQYVRRLEEFLESPTLLDLKSAIQDGLIPRQECTDATCRVVITLSGKWGTISFSIFREVIKYIIGKELLTHIEIKPGSIVVSFLAPVTHSHSLVDRASLKVEFMNRIGIIDMYISDSLVIIRSCHQLMNTVLTIINLYLMQLKEGHVFDISVLLQLGANINHQNNEGDALILASRNGHEQVVQSLLMAGAIVNAQNNKGYSALMAACSGTCNLLLLGYLLEVGADPNLQLTNGETLLL